MGTLDAVREGDILFRGSSPLPIALNFRAAIEGENLIEGTTANEVESLLQKAGCHFFCLTPDIRATRFAHSEETAVQKALSHLFAKAVINRINAVEIDEVLTRQIFGMYGVTVTAKMRHIQESPYLFLTEDGMRQRLSRVSYQPDPRARQLLERADFKEKI